MSIVSPSTGVFNFGCRRLPPAYRYYSVGAGRVERLPDDANVVTFFGSGRRASIAASILGRNGIKTVTNNFGSMAACQALGCQIVV
ncbi:MAG: hypothetical protein GVY16_07670 [Planctomycetes bacterium]|nr:rhodanese-like domain-containing protein [Phycisphaerae bacterium]NBB95605.1 hypothetical protein [Planctomycetota bacterium]